MAAGSQASPGPRSISTRHATLLETLWLLQKKLDPLQRESLCPLSPSCQRSKHLPACLPAALAGRHCHLLPAARQDTPACLCHPALALLHPCLQGTVPAGTLQHRVPQALGHLHTEPPFADAPLAPNPVGSTELTAPAQQQGAQGSRASVPPSTSRSTLLKGCVRGWYARLQLMKCNCPAARGWQSSVPNQGSVPCQQPSFASTSLATHSFGGFIKNLSCQHILGER